MKKRLNHNGLGLKILAFVLACFLWLIVVNVDDPVISKTFTDIPVSVINEDILLNSNVPQTYQIIDNTQSVDVTVTAQRKVLNRMRADDIEVTADMNELTLDSLIPLNVEIASYEGNYNSATTDPGNLQVKLEEESTKVFPINAVTTGTLRDGYVLGSAESSPEKVTIRGPKSVIESINRVDASASVSGVSKDAVMVSKLALYDENNQEIDQSHLVNNLGDQGVSVLIHVLKSKTVNIRFDTSKIKAASGYEISEINYEPQTIKIAAEAEVLSGIDEISVPASALIISGLKEKTEQTVKLSEYLPEGVQLADSDAGAVIVSISVAKHGARTFESSLGSITVNGLSDLFRMSYVKNDAIELQISGPKSVLDGLTLEKALSIDLSDYTKKGEYDVPVKVTLPEGCSLEKDISIRVKLEKRSN